MATPPQAPGDVHPLAPGWTSKDNASLNMHPISAHEQKHFHFGPDTTAPGSVIVPIPTTEQIVDALLTDADKAIWSDWVSKRDVLRTSQGAADSGIGGASITQPSRHFRLLFQRHAEGTHQTVPLPKSRKASDNPMPVSDPPHKWTVPSADVQELTTYTLTSIGEEQADEMGEHIKALSHKGELNVRAVVGSSSPRAWQTGRRTFSDDCVGSTVPRLVTDLLVEQPRPRHLNESRGALPDFLAYLGSEEDRDSDPWLGSDGNQRSETNAETRKRTMAATSVVVKIAQILAELDEAKRDIEGDSGSDSMPIDIAIPAHTIVPGDLVSYRIMPSDFEGGWGFLNASIYAVDFDFEVDGTGPTKDVTDPDWEATITSTAIGALHLPFEVPT